MRENMGLFRGKWKNGEYWAFGSLIIVRDYYYCILQDEDAAHPMDFPYLDGEIGTIDGKATPVEPPTVGEYTGLTDKNGNRIFEGDVVSGLFLYALPINGVCVFKDGAFGLEWKRGGAKEFTPFTSMCNVQYEVVGNIYDNAELKGAVNDN